jgi:glycosyltransferase involved in cell wall biosynthesis
MRIVITAPWAERLGGAENMLWALLRHLDRERVQPYVVFFEDGPFRKEVAELGIQTAVVRTGRLRHFWRAPLAVGALARLLRRERPDVVLNWMAKTQLYGAPAVLVSGVRAKVVWWQHGISGGHWMDRLATLMPAAAIGCSSHAAADAQARLRPRRKTFVVHPGIDPPPERPSGEPDRRSALGVPADRLVIGIVGRLQPDKRQHRVIEAIRNLRERGHDVHGLVVGGDAWNLAPKYEPRLHRLVSELQLDDVVTFTGQVADATPLIASMDILVNASVTEGCPLVLLEAMALGVPVVATADSGGPAEVIERDRSGILSPNSDPAELADALERLLTSADLRRGVGDGGRRRFRDRFTAQRMASSFERALEATVTGGGRLEPEGSAP